MYKQKRRKNMTVYEKLIKVQKELKAPKNQRNSFGNYNYRSCEDILEALKPVLAENGATVFLSDKPIVKENLWSYIESTVTFIDIESGESVTATAFARESESKKGMDVSQITGSASSYARKYALNGLFLIDDTKDADTDEQYNQSAGGKQKAFSKDDVTALRLDLVKVATATKKDVNQLEAWVAQQIGLNSFDSINQSNIAKANILVKQLMIKAKV